LSEHRLLLHCKKSGCDFVDILVGENLAQGRLEVDPLKVEKVRRGNRLTDVNALVRARNIWNQWGSLSAAARDHLHFVRHIAVVAGHISRAKFWVLQRHPR
jgi:hypothetical protein